MRVFVVVPPAPVVTWEEADAHLNLGGDTSQRPHVEALIAAATGHIDGPDGWLGRSLGDQTLEARFSTLGICTVKLRFPPVVSLVSVKYLDFNGVEQTADLDDFELYGDELQPKSSAWPWEGGSTNREAVRVRYRTGYPPTEADPPVSTLPAAIRAAILIMTGDLYRFRETVAGGQMSRVEISTTVEALLAPFRMYR